MPHDVTLIATIAVGFALAFVFGYIANRIHLPPMVGYLLAGVAIGPFTPGFVADSGMANQLAEIGVMLLMFGVGLHFSVPDLLAVKKVAVPGAAVQIVLATAVGAAMAMWWGWSLGAGLVLGLSLSVASTVVLLKALEERNAVASANGRIAVGWLIVEDLAMVLALVLLPALAPVLGGHAPIGHGEHGGEEVSLGMSLLNTGVKVTAFMMIALFFGPRVMPWLLKQVARTGSRELFTLGTLAFALGIAFAATKIFGVSFALGAFFAGVVLSESDLSHKAAANSLPLQDAFAVLFFVSVGMLFDWHILVNEPLKVLGVVAVILVGKSLIAFGLVWALGFPVSSGLTVSAALAQVGEFSFILAQLGIMCGLMPQAGLSLILAGAILSIALNPMVFSLVDRLLRGVRSSPVWAKRLEDSRQGPLDRLKADLETARLKLEEKAQAHKTVSPQELVSHFPLFGNLTSEQRETLILHFHNHEAQPGERIIRRGDKADAVYFISEGQVEVTLRDGRKVKISPGGFFGEMALLSGERRSADVTALDYSKFLTLNQADFRQFLKKYPDIKQHVAALAAERGQMNSAAPVLSAEPQSS
jgi:CPA2 family monovalent cation:H+ antiporter-2